ncbi:unnamed protein product [Meloidogyne enterolobii]
MCINTNTPIGKCIKGNGFGNIIDDENIKYIVKNGGLDRDVFVYAENAFNKPQTCFNYSLYYFENKCEFEGDLNCAKAWMYIGLKNLSTNKHILYHAKDANIKNEKNEAFHIPTIFNNNDIYGCGLVYPPTNKINEFPYIFFTQNGKQIGKGILLKDNFNSYRPRVYVYYCSVKTNFGNDLETKPFKYDISKHIILKEFY